MSAYEEDASAICHGCGLTFDVHELLRPLKCSRCGGEGWIEVGYGEEQADCPRCHGCGYMSREEGA